MSRSGKIKRRSLSPKAIATSDPLFQHPLIAKFINTIMQDGKKTAAQRIVYTSFEIIKAKDAEPLTVFERAIDNVAPRMEVRPRRIGGASYQVPQEVRNERKMALGIRWLRDAAAKRPSKEYHTFAEKLAAELLDASQNAGEAVKKKEGMHRMADANRAFAHFRW